ncbi:sterol desaturase family protein [Novosphingobium sp. PP1Y]|uniref:sterol desaturase family protein n=1 Tax=Novosphingobium sp. PP1Y TaxID=702113 RepID=UPI00020EF569|nr:sterol desaturase family protein [Novosphingobium sp. PP1Y]CCA93044.1 sterol desaturase-like [Novosphingobium sp. PP1Y]
MIEQALLIVDQTPFLLISYVTVLVFGTAFCASAVLHGQDRFSLRGLLRTCFPPEFYLSRSTAHDCVLWMISKLLAVSQRYIPLVVSAIIITQFLDYMAGPERSAHMRIHAGVALTGLLLVFLFVWKELVDYVLHYLHHKVPFLWELHKVHHSASSLIPITSQRGSPVEVLFTENMRAILIAIPLAVICFLTDEDVVLIFAYSGLFNKVITMVTLDPLRHSHLPIGLGPFDRIFISPHMHQVHHSKLAHHWDRNFATNLALLDWIFGTAYRPGKGEVLVYGIGADADHRQFTSLKGILFDPVVSMVRSILAGLRTGRLVSH